MDAHVQQGQGKRVAKNFHFDKESQVRLHKTDTRRTHLPIDEPIRVFDILSEYVELQEPATRTQIKRMIEYSQDPTEKAKLIELSGDDETSQAMYRRKPRHGWWVFQDFDEEHSFFQRYAVHSCPSDA